MPAVYDYNDAIILDRISIQSPTFAAALWTALEPYVSSIPSFQTHLSPPAKPHSFNPNIRLYRYGEGEGPTTGCSRRSFGLYVGQYFGAHYDDSTKDAKTKAWSEWTLLVYLTGVEDGVEGGEVSIEPCASRPAEPYMGDPRDCVL